MMTLAITVVGGWLAIGICLATYSYATACPPGLTWRGVALGWVSVAVLWPLALLPAGKKR